MLQKEINILLIKDFSKKTSQSSLQGQTPASIMFSLQGKSGLLRKSLLGKRSSQNARTVISGDPTLDVGILSVPQFVAKTLTIPTKVNDLSRQNLIACIHRGQNALDGAEFILKTNGIKKSLNNLSFKHTQKMIDDLQNGDIVYRYITDNDYLLFNRAPTLSCQSILAHKVKINRTDSSKTFRFNVQSCACYNADFDGTFFFFQMITMITIIIENILYNLFVCLC